MPSNLEKVQSISRIAGSDMSGANPGQYRFGEIQADGTIKVAGAGVRADGVILGKQIAGHAIEVGIAGRLLITYGGTVTAGDALSSDANGAAITQSSTNDVLGTALESGVAGDVGSLLFAPQGAP